MGCFMCLCGITYHTALICDLAHIYRHIIPYGYTHKLPLQLHKIRYCALDCHWKKIYRHQFSLPRPLGGHSYRWGWGVENALEMFHLWWQQYWTTFKLYYGIGWSLNLPYLTVPQHGMPQQVFAVNRIFVVSWGCGGQHFSCSGWQPLGSYHGEHHMTV